MDRSTDHPQRLHALDNLRAIMMWLGIVLHVAANHLVNESAMPWHDSKTTIAANLISGYIHSFRMPIFFILAGFFVALLVSRRDFDGMLKHRMRRIGLPFVIFWPPIFVVTVVLILLYVHLMVRGTLGLDLSLIPEDPAKPKFSTLHMWFIYYLLWFCVLTALVGFFSRGIPPQFKQRFSEIWKLLASRWWGFVILAMPLAAIGSFYKNGVLLPSGSFIPNFSELLHNGLFFLFGWHLFRHQASLLQLYAKNCWRYGAAGTLFFFLFLAFFDVFQESPGKIPNAPLWIAYLYSCVSWLWSFSLIGIFVKYLAHQNKILRYISESSYWVYLVHMMCTIGFGILLYKMPFNAYTKMGLNILATTIVCIVTYHVLVRFTPISTLLNGHRFSYKSKQKINEEKSVV